MRLLLFTLILTLPAQQPLCTSCHVTQTQTKNAGKHKPVACDTCHGPQSAHIASKGKEKPAKLAILPLCLSCHEEGKTKFPALPQVAPNDHYAGSTCTDCHLPHEPKK